MVVQMVTMARRFQMAKRPIDSVKNILDNSGNLTANTEAEIQIATAVNTYTGATTECQVGSKILAFFLSIHIMNDATQAAGSTDWFLAKRHGGQVYTDFPSPEATGGSVVRNQIFHEEKALPGGTSGPGMHFQGVIKVPRGQQRVREGDIWFISVIDQSQAGKFCLKAIYKWYK